MKNLLNFNIIIGTALESLPGARWQISIDFQPADQLFIVSDYNTVLLLPFKNKIQEICPAFI